ncbi:Uncharacterised protein [Mycobacteroides abscessus]|nr:Uncharacterised protein [Mycobacteroides abscessus]
MTSNVRPTSTTDHPERASASNESTSNATTARLAATASFEPSAVRNTTSGPSSTKFTGWIAGSAWSV